MALFMEAAASTASLSLIPSSSTTFASALSVASAEATPLIIILRPHIDGTSDFYPFEDMATLDRDSDIDFTFKQLFETGIDGDQEIVLFESGCKIDGVSDCTQACNDTEIFFGSLDTFYNCVALASITYFTQDARPFYVGEEAELNASSIMGSGTVADFNGKSVLGSFISCAKESCDNDGLGQPCNRTIFDLSTETSTAEEIFAALDSFCPDLAAEINPDIFGPGVSEEPIRNMWSEC